MPRAVRKISGSYQRPSGRRTASPTQPATSQSTASVLRVVATIGSPLALGTALLFYFGWVRAKIQARALGYDSSIMNLSTTDYILNSIDVLYIPLMLLLIVALVLNGLHQRLIVPNIRRSRYRKRLLRMAWLLEKSWILWGVLDILMLAFESAGFFSIPFSITLALLCALYGGALQKRVTGVERWSLTGKSIVMILLAFVVFWDTERVARKWGEGYATWIAEEPQRLAAVTIYSGKSLEIEAPGTIWIKLNSADSEYLYRYSGLRLLRRADGRYFLINEGWDTQQGRVFVLRETDNIRMEFTR